MSGYVHGGDAIRFARRVRVNQARLAAELKPQYDFIVCGAGSSGSVIARRLADSPSVTVLLLEAGHGDDVASVGHAAHWMANLGSERDWGFVCAPNPHVNRRSIGMPMGKVLGGGSSINVMVWARGHKEDWDHYAKETDDPRWSYDSTLAVYRRIEDWHGAPDSAYRGSGGPMFVQPAPCPNPLAPAAVEAARSVGIPTFAHPNGGLMEAASGAAIADVCLKDGERRSVFRAYTHPAMDRPNLTVLTGSTVRRIVLDGSRAVGVELHHRGKVTRIGATSEIVLSAGAVHTPKILMHSGVGDQRNLRQAGIEVGHHLPGVGANFQDHVAFDSIWEYRRPEPPQNNAGEAVLFGEFNSGATHPDFFACQMQFPTATPENLTRFDVPEQSWTFHAALSHPRSRGRVGVTSADPAAPITIEANTLAEPEDLKAALACVEWCREIGNSAPLRPYVKREVMPGDLRGEDSRDYVRNAATTFFHQCGTAKMGRDTMSVVDGDLSVYGIDNLTVADSSVLPRITVANTMAPCVVIGERAAEVLTARHGL